MTIVDTHCHLDFPEFDRDREAVMARAHDRGVSKIMIPGVRRSTWAPLIEMANSDARLEYALGLHPYFIDEHLELHVEELAGFITEHAPLAVGEIGLDFYRGDLDRGLQEKIFRAQLELASRCGLPVILHVRKAHDRVLNLLKGSGVSGGIAHAFNGSLQQAQEYIGLGFKLGFGGMLTFPRSRKLRNLAASLPLSALVLETDAPDMTVLQHQGERNSPEYLPHVLEALSEIRGEPPDVVGWQTTVNAVSALGLNID